jgi:hypothetical protein
MDLQQMASNLIAERHTAYSPPACNFNWGICDRFLFVLLDDASKVFVSLIKFPYFIDFDIVIIVAIFNFKNKQTVTSDLRLCFCGTELAR